MCFYIGDGQRIHFSDELRRPDHRGLAFDTWRGISDPVRAVVVHCRAAHDRVDGVASRARFGQSHERYDTGPVAADESAGASVE